VLRELLETADVVIDNYRPGVMDRMGFGREALKAIKPDLIVCHVTGFGMDGPYRDRPSFDFIAQAMSGFIAVNGDEGGPPLRTGNDRGLVAPYGLFEASDGEVAVAPSNDAFYLRLLEALGLQSLREREEYRTNAQRFERRAQINAEINAVTRTNTVDHWIA